MEKKITKSTLRKTILQYRRLISDTEFQKRNLQLLQKIELFIHEKSPKIIHTFLPISRNKEVDITPLFPNWWKEGKRIIVSKTNFETRKMDHYLLKKETILKNNSLGIPEPEDGDSVKIQDVDLILIPLLAVDKQRNRIGYGGGFYDHLLSETKALKVGLSLSSPLDRITQRDEWDIPLDFIISHK